MRRLWLAFRGLVELVVARAALDRWLDRLGFFELKSRLLRAERTLPDGARVLFRPDDEKILDEIHREGAYARASIGEDSLVIDVGAHIGVFSLYAARRCRRGRVIAVEPAPLNLELLRENLRRNGARNVIVHACALSERPGRAKLFSRGDHALYTLSDRAAGSIYTEVPVRTLDELAAEEGVKACAVLKIDVEGLELEVLRGGARTLAVTREVIAEADKTDDRHVQVLALLREAGFDCSIEVDTPGSLVVLARRPGA